MSGISGRNLPVEVREESLGLSQHKNLQKGFDETIVFVATNKAVHDILQNSNTIKEYAFTKGDEKKNIQVLVFESEGDAKFLEEMGAHMIIVDEKGQNSEQVEEPVLADADEKIDDPSKPELTEEELEEVIANMSESERRDLALLYWVEDNIATTRVGKWVLEKLGMEFDEVQGIDPLILDARDKQREKETKKQLKITRSQDRKQNIASFFTNLPFIHNLVQRFSDKAINTHMEHEKIVPLRRKEDQVSSITDMHAFKKKKEEAYLVNNTGYSLDEAIKEASTKSDRLHLAVNPETMKGFDEFLKQYAERIYNQLEK